ncbi:hypothetical protein PQX77_012899 [Marasmius sp. AFHP31]|nr:hypothetical protein PQX77_012899 [Marasmius sp. AFHP31]
MSEFEHQQMEDVDDTHPAYPPTVPPPPPVQHPLLGRDTAGFAAVPEITVTTPRYEIPESERLVTVGMMNEINSELSELRALIAARLPPVGPHPPAPPPPPPVQTNSTDSPGGGMRFKKPDVFKGKAETVPGFILDIRNTLYLQCAAYKTDRDKSLYLCTYLADGSPKDFLRSIDATRPELLDDFEDFLKAFKDHFGDSNIAKTAMGKIQVS